MISTDFAPNESASDAFLSFSLLLRPWQWRNTTGIKELERQISLFFPKIKHKTTFFLSGRSALFNLLSSLDVEKSSEVLVQGFTCEAVILPIIKAGFSPIFVDIDSKTYSMDMFDLEKKMTKSSRILILQHTFGIVPNRKEILALSKKNNIIVIEDLAHGFSNDLFSLDLERTIKILSFGRSKAFSSVFGGAVLTADELLHNKLQDLSKRQDYPGKVFMVKVLLYKPLAVIIKSTYKLGFGKLLHKIASQTGLLVPEITKREKSGVYDSFTDYKYSSPLIKLMLLQLRNYKKTVIVRQRSVKLYSDLLKDFSMSSSALIRIPYRVKSRASLKHAMRKKSVYPGSWYDQVIGPKGLNMYSLGYVKGSCPVAEEISEDVINLPTKISEKDLRYVVQSIRNFYGN